MTSYRRFIPPLVLIGGAVVVSVLASLMIEGVRNKEKKRQKAELNDWEGEGGSVVATDVPAR